MTRRYAWVLLAWLLAAPAYAQPVDSGNITANSSGGACTAVPPACVVVTFSNQLITTITLQVSGTYTGTTAFEATSSANPLATSAVWFAVTATNLADGSSATGTTSGQTGQFSIPNSGLMGVRVRATAAWTGTAVVSAVRGYAVAWRLSPFFTRVYTGDGSAALPARSYFSDTDLGPYRIGANNEGFSAGGTLRWDYNTTRILSTIPYQGGDGSAASPTFNMGTKGMYSPGGNALYFSVNSGARVGIVDDDLSVKSSGSFNFSSGAIGATSDVSLFRDAANTLAQRNGTNAQISRVYNTYTGAGAQEWFAIDWFGNNVRLITASVGGGTNRTLQLGSGSVGWQIPVSNNFVAATTGVGIGLAVPFAINTAPSVPVACTSPTVTWSNGTATFQIDVGTSCTGVSTLAFTMPAATNGWQCVAHSVSAPATSVPSQSAGTTTSVTLTNYVRTTGVAGDWADGADIRVQCSGG